MTSHYVNKSASKLERPLWGKMRSYNEIVEFLSTNRFYEYSEASLQRMAQLDSMYNSISKSIDTILIAGTNGKSTTINCALKIFRHEKYRVGAFFASHFLTFNEHLVINGTLISNKRFAEMLNNVINVSLQEDVNATTYELLLMAAYLFFRDEEVEVALIEVRSRGKYDAANFCSPKISAITRIADEEENADEHLEEVLELTRPGHWCISSEQSKIRLYKMKEWCEKRNVYWMMPVRKLAPLPYIYEQLFGRSASLAERIVHLYIEHVKQCFSSFLRGNILFTQQNQRGRPTYETKRVAEKNQHISLKKFWSEGFNLPRGCFEYLDKEKPAILLDTAHNGDALDNLFLGIRLLHYQRAINGCSILVAHYKTIEINSLLKRVRYLLKKIAGTLLVFPLDDQSDRFHDAHELYDLAQKLLIPVKKLSSFDAAFEEAEFTTDDRTGLITLCGSPELISAYWKMKGLKKLN